MVGSDGVLLEPLLGLCGDDGCELANLPDFTPFRPPADDLCFHSHRLSVGMSDTNLRPPRLRNRGSFNDAVLEVNHSDDA